MLQSDIKKAKELSKSLASLGYGKKQVVKQKVLKSRPSPFKFGYEALKIKDGKDGKDAVAPSHDTLRGIIEPIVKQHLTTLEAIENEAAEITPEFVKKIVQMMHDLPEMDKLEVSKGIRNASSFIYGGTKYGTHEMMHGGSNATTTTAVNNEVVAGSGTSWTLAHTPTSAGVQLYANGQRLTPTVDYTLSATSITTILSWSAGTLIADYLYA